MTPSRRLRRGRATAVITGAAIALATGLTTPGCDAAHRTMDCVRTANSIADSISDLQQATRDAALDPSKADTYFAPVNKNLKAIGHQTDNVDVNKAVQAGRQEGGQLAEHAERQHPRLGPESLEGHEARLRVIGRFDDERLGAVDSGEFASRLVEAAYCVSFGRSAQAAGWGGAVRARRRDAEFRDPVVRDVL